MSNESKPTHRDLVTLGAEWLNKIASNIHYRCQFVAAELKFQGAWEIPDILGLDTYHPVVIEVKTSKQDYLRDKKKMGRRTDQSQLGAFRFYLTPAGLLNPDNLPEKWGLLEYDGTTIEIIKAPVYFTNHDWRACLFAYHSILRRTQKYQVFRFRK